MLHNRSLNHTLDAEDLAIEEWLADPRMVEPVRRDERIPGFFRLRWAGYEVDLTLQLVGRENYRQCRPVTQTGQVWMPPTGLEQLWREVQADRFGRRCQPPS